MIIETTAESLVDTGLKDHFGNEIYEGDYVTLITRSDHSNECGRVGRVIWDQRRNSWQVITMVLPSTNIRPQAWGRAVADWLNEITAEKYEVARYCFDEYDGDWQPKTFFSGGVEIPLTKKADNAVYTPTNQNKKLAD